MKLPLRLRRWYKRRFTKHYITSFAEAADFPVMMSTNKCPGCGNYVEPYAPGHTRGCPYSAEKNVRASSVGRHAR